MTEADIIAAIATIVTRMYIFLLLLLGDFFSEEDACDDNRGNTIKQYNTKDIEYNR